jgi:cytidylate kinase
MYRAVTLYFLRRGVDLSSSEQVQKALSEIELGFVFNPARGASDIVLNGENVEPLIREMQVAEQVSKVAALASVRKFAVQQQQRMGAAKGIVMDGRDIGTVVFPGAELKIFMTADKETRVQRRYLELSVKDPAISIEAVRENLERRDHLDATREESPLRQAHDAKVLDNTSLTPTEQLHIALGWARAALG